MPRVAASDLDRLAGELGERKLAEAQDKLTQSANLLALAAADLEPIAGAHHVRRRAIELNERVAALFDAIGQLAGKLRANFGVHVDRETVRAELALRASQSPGGAQAMEVAHEQH